MYTHRLVDLTVSLVRETDKAWLVSDGERNTRLTKSACELEPLAGGKHYTLTLNEAYAIEKGLV